MASIIKSDNGVSSGITGIVQSADSSGQLVLQTTTSGGTATTAVTIDNTQKVTFANAITPSTTNGIVGTTLGDNAVAGSVGEYVSSTVANGTVSFSNGTPLNVTSISLTAGDWDVWGRLTFGSSSIPSTLNSLSSGVSSVTSSFNEQQARFYTTAAQLNGYNAEGIPPMTRYNLTTTTTIYLVGNVYFSGGNVNGGGFIGARRRR